MNKRFLPFFFFALSISFLLPAQDYYTTFVGSFVNARPQDFNEARKLGFIYTQINADQLEEVYLGQYPSQDKATSTVQALVNLGFTNAQVVAGSYGDATEVPVIQIATRYSNKTINWENLSKAGPLNVLIADGTIKVLTGTFANLESAKAELPQIRALGFSDAFVKLVKRGQILPVTDLATGIKEDLIPLTLTDTQAPPTNPSNSTVRPEPTNSPVQPSATEPRSPYVPRPSGNEPEVIPTAANLPDVRAIAAPARPAVPTIRGNIKRSAVTGLQRVLQAEGYYNSTLDGYYGNGTTAAYERMLNQDQRIQKYRLLIPFYGTTSSTNTGGFQGAIDQLPYDPNAPLVIESNSAPVGQAYQAYLLFTSLGPSVQVNQLMNSAIKRAYANSGVSTSAFNYQATYAYQDLQQLLQHLFFIHAAPTTTYTLPCWFNDRHPNETTQALRQMGNYSSQLTRSGCDPFSEWEEVKLLQTIAFDIAPETSRLTAERQATQSLLSELALSTEAVAPTQATLLDTWQNNFWQNINSWAAKDAYLQGVATSLRFAYFQSAVRLEDYFMDRGFDSMQARPLAIAALRAMLEVPLEKFE